MPDNLDQAGGWRRVRPYLRRPMADAGERR